MIFNKKIVFLIIIVFINIIYAKYNIAIGNCTLGAATLTGADNIAMGNGNGKLITGGNNNLLIHTDWSEKNYEEQGILEETFVHEAAHTSLDSYHAESEDWYSAQTKDCNFISDYARDNPIWDDIAESYLPYLAIRYRVNRISNSLKDSIENIIPNRIDYLDKQNFDMYPIN